MNSASLAHLGDDDLVRRVHLLVARDRALTAALLAHLAEVDARRLYAPAGYSSMHAWCVGELRLSDDAAYKRITAARAARRFPVLLSRLEDGSLHLSAVKLLAAHLTPDNCDELIGLASSLSAFELARELGRRSLPLLAGVTSRPGEGSATATPAVPASESAAPRLATWPVAPAAAVAPPAPPTAVEPRFVLHVAIEPSTRAKLVRAQALLGHSVPTGDIAQVLDRALDALIRQVEKRKFAATARQRPPRERPVGARFVPAHVRREVWKRDGGACTFVGTGGRTCGSRKRLEYDHVQPVARGGTATVDGIRLRCRTHNQLEAERALGRTFMEGRRKKATAPIPPGETVDTPLLNDLANGLRHLGFRADEVRRGRDYARTLADASLADRLRATLRFLRPPRVDGGAGAAPHSP